MVISVSDKYDRDKLVAQKETFVHPTSKKEVTTLNEAQSNAFKRHGWVKKEVGHYEYEKKNDTNEREQLLAKAREMGLNPHHMAGESKLREMIAKAESQFEPLDAF